MTTACTDRPTIGRDANLDHGGVTVASRRRRAVSPPQDQFPILLMNSSRAVRMA